LLVHCFAPKRLPETNTKTLITDVFDFCEVKSVYTRITLFYNSYYTSIDSMSNTFTMHCLNL
jgi:hypothetical protein